MPHARRSFSLGIGLAVSALMGASRAPAQGPACAAGRDVPARLCIVAERLRRLVATDTAVA